MASTLRDVANRANVSIKTVSNVVNNPSVVSPKTRAHVQAALDELDYHPNLTARHLRNQQAGVLALAIPDLSNAYFADVGTAVIAAAAARGYTVLLDHTAGDRTQELLVVNGLRPHLIDGVIMSPQGLEAQDLRSIRERIPIVLLGERVLGTAWDHVVIDNVEAARTATAHLVSVGRRRIGAIGVPKDMRGDTSRLRLRGFTAALTQAEIPILPQLLVPAAGFRRGDGVQAHRADGAHAMRQLLSLPEPPDAVFCFNDLLALGAIRALHDAAYSVPDDVAVIGFDDLDEGLFAFPSLSTIAPSKAEIGQLAVSLLIDRIQGARTDESRHVEPSFQLLARESTVGVIATSAAQSAGDREQGRWQTRSGGAAQIDRASD